MQEIKAKMKIDISNMVFYFKEDLQSGEKKRKKLLKVRHKFQNNIKCNVFHPGIPHWGRTPTEDKNL